MNKFRIGGMSICAGTFILAGLFLWGMAAGEPWRFWAIAVPVIIFFSAALGIAFSIGRLMASTQVEDAVTPQIDDTPASSTDK
ncbi:MAG: hypothetical protein IBX68_06040 [Dehalococcoidia bacterium]|nr:hypothetical protein [Dehalococcoidia bacterium]